MQQLDERDYPRQRDEYRLLCILSMQRFDELDNREQRYESRYSGIL